MEWSPIHPSAQGSSYGWVLQFVCRSCGSSTSMQDIPACPQSRVLSVPLLLPSSLTGPLDALCTSAFPVNSSSLMTVSALHLSPLFHQRLLFHLTMNRRLTGSRTVLYRGSHHSTVGDVVTPLIPVRLFSPLISLGLAFAESRMGVPPYSLVTGSRFLLSNLSSGPPTHSPSSVHTPITSTLWTVSNLQLHSCSHGLCRTGGCHPSQHHVHDCSLALRLSHSFSPGFFTGSAECFSDSRVCPSSFPFPTTS